MGILCHSAENHLRGAKKESMLRASLVSTLPLLRSLIRQLPVCDHLPEWILFLKSEHEYFEIPQGQHIFLMYWASIQTISLDLGAEASQPRSQMSHPRYSEQQVDF